MNKRTVILFYPSPWEGEHRGRIPYALLYLERMIRDMQLNIILIDEQVTRDYMSILMNVKDDILLAGVSAMTGYQIIGGIKFSEAVKRVSDCPVVWGGWHATLLPEQLLAKDYVDYVVVGQGEIPFQKMISALLNNEPINTIKAVGSKQNGQFIINPADKFMDINNFPRINLSLIDINNYIFKSAYSDRCIGYFSSHGCPYDCAFCCVAEVYGRRWYRKKIDDIIDDLKYFKRAANVDSITFDDDNFFVNKTFTMELTQQFIEQNLNLTWDTSAHAALFLKLFQSPEIEQFYRSGCRQIYIGAESGDQAMLDLIAKQANVEDNFGFVEILNKHKITPLLSTMVAFPVDPDRDIRMTIDMIRRLKLFSQDLRARIFFYTPYPGTELYNKARDNGFRPPDELEGWAKHTLRKFHAPWWKRDYRWQLELFANFYLPLANPSFYKIVPAKQRPFVFLINMFFYPVVILRFRLNFLKFPVEALLFLFMLRMFNKIAGTKYALGYESYFD